MQIGDLVIKGNGVYRIKTKTQEAIASSSIQEYLVLEEVYASGFSCCTLHVPVERASETLQEIPSRKSLKKLLSSVDRDPSLAWIKDNNKRADLFHSVAVSGDLAKTIQVARAYREHRRADETKGTSTRDREIESLAMKLIRNTTAASFGIEPDKAEQMVDEYLD